MMEVVSFSLFIYIIIIWLVVAICSSWEVTERLCWKICHRRWSLSGLFLLTLFCLYKFLNLRMLFICTAIPAYFSELLLKWFIFFITIYRPTYSWHPRLMVLLEDSRLTWYKFPSLTTYTLSRVINIYVVLSESGTSVSFWFLSFFLWCWFKWNFFCLSFRLFYAFSRTLQMPNPPPSTFLFSNECVLHLQNEFPLLSRIYDAYSEVPAFLDASPQRQPDTPPEYRS